MKIVKGKVLILIFIIMSINIYGNQIEYIYGNYKYVDKDISIEFKFNNDGVSKFRLDQTNYNKKLSYELLGIYGSTYILKIKIAINESDYLILTLLIIADENKIYSNTGLLTEMRYKNDVNFDILRQKNLYFNIVKCEP